MGWFPSLPLVPKLANHRLIGRKPAAKFNAQELLHAASGNRALLGWGKNNSVPTTSSTQGVTRSHLVKEPCPDEEGPRVPTGVCVRVA